MKTYAIITRSGIHEAMAKTPGQAASMIREETGEFTIGKAIEVE